MRNGRLRLRGVEHTYRGGAPVLTEADVAVAGGDIVVVHGRNGAGKTTLLRIAAGVLSPHHGAVERDGRIAYLPQRSDDPPPRLSARTWLRALSRMKGAATTLDHLETLRTLGVDSVAAPLDTLSVGTLAKVMLTSVFDGSPDVLVLDEPFAALDPPGREAALGLIVAAARDGAAVLLSDHDRAAVSIATQIATITDGRLVLAAAPNPTRRTRVVGLDAAGTPVDVVIPADERDAMLLRLLGGGGSVHRVEDAL